jgi:TonB family protein
MKRLIILFLLIGNQAFSQGNQSLEKLISIRVELVNQIGILEDSLFKVNYQIKQIIKLEEVQPLEVSPGDVDRISTYPSRESKTTAVGEGVNYSLSGRSALSLPQPEYPKQKSGKVIVRVTVDRNGNVLTAEGGQQGSTTLDNDLINAAEKAAKLAKFDVSPNAPASQTGTITYIFKLQQ